FAPGTPPRRRRCPASRRRPCWLAGPTSVPPEPAGNGRACPRVQRGGERLRPAYIVFSLAHRSTTEDDVSIGNGREHDIRRVIAQSLDGRDQVKQVGVAGNHAGSIRAPGNILTPVLEEFLRRKRRAVLVELVHIQDRTSGRGS